MTTYHKLAEADPGYRPALATATTNLGYYHTRYRKAADALKLFNMARGVLDKLVAEQPHDLEARSELRRVHTNIGYAHQLAHAAAGPCGRPLHRGQADRRAAGPGEPGGRPVRLRVVGDVRPPGGDPRGREPPRGSGHEADEAWRRWSRR